MTHWLKKKPLLLASLDLLVFLTQETTILCNAAGPIPEPLIHQGWLQIWDENFKILKFPGGSKVEENSYSSGKYDYTPQA